MEKKMQVVCEGQPVTMDQLSCLMTVHESIKKESLAGRSWAKSQCTISSIFLKLEYFEIL